jgi:hypothetical protein
MERNRRMDHFLGPFEIWFKEWGPGLLIALVMLYGLYQLMIKIGERVGIKIIEALEKPAAALDKQAGAMDRLSDTIKDYIICERSDHKEMIILLKITLEKIETLKGERDGGNK